MTLPQLAAEILQCRRCPRLVRNHRAFARAMPTAHAAPVPGNGPGDARIWIIGLAPGARGAAITGIPFTLDRSGRFLRSALERAGISADHDVFISNVLRCLPPANKPVSAELRRCLPFLQAESDLLKQVRVVLCLGRHAFSAAATLHNLQRPPFAHGRELPTHMGRTILASYHVSPLNVNTLRLTAERFDALLHRARTLLQHPATGHSIP